MVTSGRFVVTYVKTQECCCNVQ